MLKLGKIWDPDQPRRTFGLIIGGAIVAIGMSLVTSGGQSSETPPEGEKAEAAAEGEEGANKEAAKGEEEMCATDEEVARLAKQLRSRHEQLEADWLALEREQEELAEQRKDLDDSLRELRELRKEVSLRIKSWELRESKERADRLNRLIGIVGKMNAQSAAELLRSTEPSLAVDVLLQLEDKNAGKILSLIPPKDAAALARKVAAFRARQEEEN